MSWTSWSRSCLLAIALASGFAQPLHAEDLEAFLRGLRERVVRFATLPSGTPTAVKPAHPEGLAIDRFGNIYAPTFEIPGAIPMPPGSTSRACQLGLRSCLGGPALYPQNVIYVFDPFGRFKFEIPLPLTPNLVAPLGLEFDRRGNLFLLDVLNGDVLMFRGPLTPLSVPVRTFDVCTGFIALMDPNDPLGCALNDIVLGPDGWWYMSDNGFAGGASLRARIFRLNPETGFSEVFYADPALFIGGDLFPPFGVNGLAFHRDGFRLELLMANMSTDTIFRKRVRATIPSRRLSLTNPLAPPQGPPTPLPGVVAAPDDMLIVRERGKELLLVSSGANLVAELDVDSGQVVNTIGSFLGLAEDGGPRGLLGPSSLVTNGRFVFVSNEANPTAGHQPMDALLGITTWTVSRFRP
jgi:hypothetical protein